MEKLFKVSSLGYKSMIAPNIQTFFRSKLLSWANTISRPMPWKGEKDPYLIWLSEIILQQTRVQQGMPYFESFKRRYPKVEDLANAPEDELMKLWQGLGYYSRARNLHAAAKQICREYNGQFPANYDQLLSLPGVGPYTAAAIASFAFGLPHAVLDGNVFRILSRFFGQETPIDTTSGKRSYAQLAQELLDERQAGKYNQAIMDFGALQCVPKNPNCRQCPLNGQCVALRQEMVDQLPIKEKKLQRKDRYFQYFILQWDQEVILQKRTEKDIWRQLYQFPLIETQQLEFSDWSEHAFWQQIQLPEQAKASRIVGPLKQQLTHQRIIGTFREISLPGRPPFLPESFLVVDRKNLSKFAFPKLIDCYLQDNSLNLFN